MRVEPSSPPITAPGDAGDAASRTAAPGDFRAALRVAGRTDDDRGERPERIEDTTATAAKQLVYLARAAGLTDAPPGSEHAATGTTGTIGTIGTTGVTVPAGTANPAGDRAAEGAHGADAAAVVTARRTRPPTRPPGIVIDPVVPGARVYRSRATIPPGLTTSPFDTGAIDTGAAAAAHRIGAVSTSATIATDVAAGIASGVAADDASHKGGLDTAAPRAPRGNVADGTSTAAAQAQLVAATGGLLGGATGSIVGPAIDHAHPARGSSARIAGTSDNAGATTATAAGSVTAQHPGATTPSATTPTAAPADSPIAVWRAAAGRTGSAGDPGPDAVDAPADSGAAASIAAPTGAAPASPAAAALTPLEQAVHDLMSQLATRTAGRDRAARPTGDAPEPIALPGLVPHPLATCDAPAPSPAGPAHAATSAPVAAQVSVPDSPANPSHVHLVIDDGPERVVATVAMRGSEVHVALRATDDATAAALARNAGSLDHAMRSRGLHLGDLTAEREPRERRPSQDAEARERRERPAERFELEENT